MTSRRRRIPRKRAIAHRRNEAPRYQRDSQQTAQPLPFDTNNVFEIVLPCGMHDEIRKFLFSDSRCERLGVILAGVSKRPRCTQLLGRQFVPVPREEVVHESHGAVEATRRFSQALMQRCAETGLSQTDVHSHPFGPSPDLHFSGIDDRHERELANYVHKHLPGTFYASIVMNQAYTNARVWLPTQTGARPSGIRMIKLAEFPYQVLSLGAKTGRAPVAARRAVDIFDRQIRAFGASGQARMEAASVAVVGAGGLGSILVDGLVRLGFRSISIIDPDLSELTNLNRVVGMRRADAEAKTPKAQVAARMARQINPAAEVKAFVKSVFDPTLLPVLKNAELLVVATDNHASRLFVQRIGLQYLIPVVSVGVNIDVAANGKLEDVSGEYAIALPGASGWCLSCAHAIDSELAAWELASPDERARWVSRGYVQGADEPAPAVRHLNGVTADLALGEIHNLFAPFKKFQSYVFYNQLASELLPVTIERNRSCALCGDRGVLGLGDLEPVPDYLRDQRGALNFPSAPVPEGLCANDMLSDGTSEDTGEAE